MAAIIDKSNMRKMILEIPKQFGTGLDSAKDVKVQGNFDALTLCGMGGSSLAGDILRIWLKDSRIGMPIFSNRDYGLPHFVDLTHLVVINSYSGNTEETLSSFNDALKKNLKIAVITSGGKLENLCRKNRVPFAKIPSGLPPRISLGLQFAALMKILVNCGMIQNSLESVLDLGLCLKPKKFEASGKRLAEKLANKVPIVYASERLKYLAKIWKIKFNENSKIPAFHNYFPELNHNEMVGFGRVSDSQPSISNFHILILRDKSDHPRNLKRMRLTAEILKSRGIKSEFIDVYGKNILQKVFSNIILSDWVSYYLAINYKVDPSPVKINDEFKKKMGGFS
ncbi:MAG: bifunctional phosphoglucose/phosphomannose isomerase [Candidatus Nealsonbacteria bacterium]|nr:bifunctional phosphoglucose/phosphomannose isomerase [Candidatus Nealsonbacteria bacterium]